jgi:ribose transport system permease protein
MSVNVKSLKRLKLTADGVQNLTMFGIFIIICIVGIILKPNVFPTLENTVGILVSTTSVVITASAVTLVLISGNLDLSVAGIGAMAGVLFGLFAKAGLSVGLSAILAIACGAISGLVNGIIISALNQPSFIITLAVKYVTSGIALIGAGGASIASGLPGDIGDLGKTISGIPLPVVFALGIFLLFLFIQNRTVFASQVYAIGSNIKTARFSGISTVKVITTVFILSGMAAAFTGVVVVSRFTVVDCSMLPGLETDCIIAAVLGGTDINGGRGTVMGMLIGALIVGVLTNIFTMLGITIYDQQVVKGVVLVLAILVNNTVRNKIKV